MLSKDARLHGTCVAFEPRQFDEKQENFALYVCRVFPLSTGTSGERGAGSEGV